MDRGPAPVLMVDGLGAAATDEQLHAAFSRVGGLLALSVPRDVATGACIGHAFVTVAPEAVPHVLAVTQVGASMGLRVFRVALSSWQVGQPVPSQLAPPLLLQPMLQQQQLQQPMPVVKSAVCGGVGVGVGAPQPHGPAQQQVLLPQGQAQQQQFLLLALPAAGMPPPLELPGTHPDLRLSHGNGPAHRSDSGGECSSSNRPQGGHARAPPPASPDGRLPAEPSSRKRCRTEAGLEDAGAGADLQVDLVAAAGPGPPIPAVAPHLLHLWGVFEALRAKVGAGAAGPASPDGAASALGYNNKTFFMSLAEAAARRKMDVQEDMSPLGNAFMCSLQLVEARSGEVKATVRGVASSKKGAKQAAAADMLNEMLAAGLLGGEELLAGLLCRPLEHCVGRSPARLHAERVLASGQYLRADALMADLHSVLGGRSKTLLMVLNEFAAKMRATVDLVEVHGVPDGAPGLVGTFSFEGIFRSQGGEVLAQAAGPAFRTKQDAKHAAAAALLEALLAAESLDPSLVMPREGTAKK